LAAAADIVDAIENRELQSANGWDLQGWQYQLIPWGVRFYQTNRNGGWNEASVVVTASTDMGDMGGS